MKDAYYFPHDSNASQDPKCSALLKDFGFRGYGIYWALIELLHEQGGRFTKFPKLLEGLAYTLTLPIKELETIITALINDYQLLKEDENYIWSDRVIRNLEKRNAKRQDKVDAGRKGGIISAMTRHKDLLEAPLKQNEPKESKVKESKVKLKSDLLSIVLKYKELKNWEKVSSEFYPRNIKTAKIILKDCQTAQGAVAFLEWCSERAKSKNLDWSLETCIKWFGEWQKSKDNKPSGVWSAKL